MLENVNLDRKLGKQTWQHELPALQRRLFDLEKACWDNGKSSIIVFEGWEAAGKGGAISTLTARLDARGFKLYAITPPRTYEQEYVAVALLAQGSQPRRNGHFRPFLVPPRPGRPRRETRPAKGVAQGVPGHRRIRADARRRRDDDHQILV